MMPAATQTTHRSLWKRLGRLHPVAHSVLIAGCILFGFPFFWLLSTSMKETQEVFSDPPQWVPALPPAGAVSPYIAQDEYRQPPVPGALSNQQWRTAWPRLQTELWNAGLRHLGSRAAGFNRQQLFTPLTRGLWERLAAGLPDAEIRDVARTPAKVAPLLDDTVCKAVWERIYESLDLRTPSIQDQSYQTYSIPATDGGWRVDTPAVASLRIAADSDTAVREQTWRAHYDFHHGNVAHFTYAGRMPVTASGKLMRPADFLRITVPLRPDHSYHRITITADIGGTVYRSEQPLLIDTDLWQDAAWQIRSEEEESTLFRDYIALAPAGRSATAPNQIKVVVSVVRNSRLHAAYDKALRNYHAALQFLPMTRYLCNTLILVLLTVLGQLVSCSLVAYSFARLRWPGRDILFAILLATMMLPGQVTMIPVFLIFKYLGWYNTLRPLWIGSLFGSAFFIFMLRQFMRSIPKELEEAAKIDGCSYFGCYWRIILPLMKPALAAVAIFTFMDTWNNFMGPLIYLNDQRLYPLSLGLFQFRLEHATDFGMLMSASTLMTLPVVAVFFFAQKHFIQGVTLTGMKG